MKNPALDEPIEEGNRHKTGLFILQDTKGILKRSFNTKIIISSIFLQKKNNLVQMSLFAKTYATTQWIPKHIHSQIFIMIIEDINLKWCFKQLFLYDKVEKVTENKTKYDIKIIL